MTEEGYKVAEAAVAENLFQVSTLGGNTKTLHVEYGQMWEGFKKLVETEFDIPRGLQKLVQGDEVLQFDHVDCIVELVENAKLPEDEIITVARISGSWFWADATGKDPSPDYSDHSDSYKSLRKICEWLEDSHGEDTCTEALGAGVIHVPGGDFPQTSAGLLTFLSGDEEHKPVAANDEDGDEIACPWNGIADMAVVTISDIWPPPRAVKSYYGHVTPYPSAEEVTRALICASPTATEDEVKDLASKSSFFACAPHTTGGANYWQPGGSAGALKKNTEMEDGSYFFEKDHPDPHVYVCANPTKQTIAFCYQTTCWD